MSGNKLAMLIGQGASSDDIAVFLDGQDRSSRLATVRGLPGRCLGQLYDLVEGATMDLDHFVPTQVGEGAAVRHLGVNSLPLFRQFEKRFVRASGGDQLWGYNHQAMGWLTGPGYFGIRQPAASEALCIDYHSVPAATPVEGWPRVRSNERFPDRLVYGFMRDHMRRVSQHVSIGQAEKKGSLMDTWFALVRIDTPTGGGE